MPGKITGSRALRAGRPLDLDCSIDYSDLDWLHEANPGRKPDLRPGKHLFK